ncbi:MAG: hypothetical protein MZW92_70180 [Comamonadaceae bacterium]|nr:hypothetical protein [Comamonadaceae bacterium]
MQTLRALEFEPRAVQAAQQIAGLVNLSRAALQHGRRHQPRRAGQDAWPTQQAIRVAPREPGDRWRALRASTASRAASADELRAALGPDAVVARSVNGAARPVGRLLDRRATATGCRPRPRTPAPLTGSTWFVWIGIALLATLVGSVAIARLINRPLKQLSFAASRIREGDLDSRARREHADQRDPRGQHAASTAWRASWPSVEEDRAVMLAGISHDLRTPLARLRLETEMSVSDEEAKRNMALDIDQLDAIIDKFMDYARPGETELTPVHLAQLIDREAAALPRPDADPHHRRAWPST